MAAIDPDQKFPFPEFTIAMGFFLLLTIEQIISDVRHRRLKPPTWLSHQVPSLNNVIVQSPSGPSSIYETDDDHSTLIDNENVSTSVPAQSDEGTQNNNDQQCGPSTIQSSQEEAEYYHSMRIVAMIIALSVHSTFEGIAIGVQTTQDDVLQVTNKQCILIISKTHDLMIHDLFCLSFQITGALALHKIVIAFSLGLALVQSPLGALKSTLCGLLFAVTSPFGIAIGLGVTLYEGDICGSLIVGSLQGMAAGTFLYVTFLDVLPHEFKNGEFRLPKLLSFIVGFSVIVGALFLFPDA